MSDNRKIEYKQLPGASRRSGFMSYKRDKLLLAPDHLLHLLIDYYSENNKRFYYKDIQALVVSKTNAGRNLSIAIGIIMAVMALPAVPPLVKGNLSNDAGAIVFLILSGTIGIFFIASIISGLIWGPTCVCKLYTAVQTEEFPSLRRMRTAEKAIRMLKPLIEAAQGTLTTEALDTSSPQVTEYRPSTHALQPGSTMLLPGGVKVEQPLKHENGKYHIAFFGMLMFYALSSLFDVFYQNPIKNRIDSILLIPFAILIIIALIKQTGSDLPKAVRIITWISFGSFGGFFFIGIYAGMFYRFANPELLKNVNPFDMRLQGPEFALLWLAQAAVFSILALMGLMRLNAFRSNYEMSNNFASSPGTTGEVK